MQLDFTFLADDLMDDLGVRCGMVLCLGSLAVIEVRRGRRRLSLALAAY
jgi:hypothetical protein